MIQRLFQTYRRAFAGLPREVWLLSGAALVNRSGTMVMPFMTLYLTTQRGYTPAEAGRMLSLCGAGGLSGAYAGGWLCDRFGPVRVQVGSLVLTAIGFLVLGRLESGLGIGIALFLTSLVGEVFRPANSTAVATFSPADLRPRAYGLMRLAVNLGMSIGPAAGGFLALVGYGFLFAADAATCLAAGAILFATMRAARPVEEPARPGREGSRAEGRAPWRDGAFLVFLLFNATSATVFFQFESTYPLYLRNHYHLAENEIGLLFTVNTLLIVAVEMLLVSAVQGRDPLRVVAFGVVLVGTGFGLLPFGGGALYVAFTVVVWTFGEMLALPLSTTFVANRSSPSTRGRYMAFYAISFSSASVIAPIAGTAIYEGIGPDAVWHACMIVGLAAGGALTLLSRKIGKLS